MFDPIFGLYTSHSLMKCLGLNIQPGNNKSPDECVFNPDLTRGKSDRKRSQGIEGKRLWDDYRACPFINGGNQC